MADGRLIYCPLGGAGEIGMNCYLYGWGKPGAERFIIVDLGVTFPAMDSTPGVSLILPAIDVLRDRIDRIEAIFITHGHEDHAGALGHLYHMLGAPRVVTRAFTGAVVRGKLADHGVDADTVEVIKSYPAMTNAGPFTVGFMPVPHSIPEASGLVIDTPAGRVVHTGDFKIDPDPVVGEPFDRAAWADVAGTGIHALVCDSTNVFCPALGRSEAGLTAPVTRLIEGAGGLVVATTFASNVARLKTLAQAGVDAGRSVCIPGRAMQRILGYARSSGLVDDFPPTVEPEDARNMPHDTLMLIVTGSQGERRSGSDRLAGGNYLGFQMREGDMFLFSSKTIPGNEISVGRIVNALSEQGVTVIDDSTGAYHVSGHANRPDLEATHEIFNPAMVIPMHGEHRHLSTHASLARANGRRAGIVPNGSVAELTASGPRIVEHIETGRTYLDGSRLIGAFDGVVLERLRMATRGVVVVVLLLKDNALPGNPLAACMGLPDTPANQASLQEVLEGEIKGVLAGIGRDLPGDDDAIGQLVNRTVGKVCKNLIGRKPVVKVLINRLAA
ncbi:MAG: ribonuclease J [Rhodobacteraceae bacterium]|nr:ribonuclease J [Paracoccaceae bacterium]